MDTRIGLDYIVENREYVGKLGAALDTNNVTVKKQVFELLSALCAYSPEGYNRALDTLEHYKNLKNERYRLKMVVTELDKTTTVEYQIVLLAFINCVVISALNLQERVRIRNEFIGLNILPVLNNLRREASKLPDLAVQLDVFDEQRECDEAQSLQGPDGINLSSHLDVFYAILRQVADTPQEIPFLSILQHLLRIEPKEAISDIIWDTTETLVHRATLLENREDSTRLLRSPSVQKFSCPHCRGDPTTSPNRKTSVAQVSTTISNIPPPPPPINLLPPPIPPCNIPLPPPPPPPFGLSMAGGPTSLVPPAPPAPNLLSAQLNKNQLNQINRPVTPEPIYDSTNRLPQQETPVPKSKMKTINWNKIPPNKVLGKHNIWSIVADSHQNSPMADLDWAEMEGLFCQQTTQPAQGSPKLGRDVDGNGTLERKSKKENSEITLLDGKRSLNVNIFLKQFRSSNEDIIQLIKNGDHDDIGAEKLRGLLKILPEIDELDMLKSFDGDKNRLGNAEKFLLQMLQIPNYKLRIESMLLKEEFAANMSYLEPCINAMIYAGDDLMTNKLLQEVLYMVVVAGNFLNSGGYAGNAAGVKLSSLQKLTDIRANKPGMNLIHYVATQAEKRNKELLAFPGQLSTLENSAKTSVEQLHNEINALDTRIKKIKRQIELPATDEDIKSQMTEFLQVSERDVNMLQRGMKEIETLRLQLADFFCEDPGAFKLEECFKVFQSFCDKFKQAVNENERRKVQEEQAVFRRKQREEQLKKRQLSQAGTPVSDSEYNFLDPLQMDVRSSPAMMRRRIGSFNSNNDQSIIREDGMSPDITPNGSLRRRRSRVLSEEDEGNLMDFLRSSGHDSGTRERKSASYGSLDRSWARRARTGSSSKKRPDLLNVDFNADRERASSPSPLAESKPIVDEEVKPRISREWRQKIESWLQSNENDDKANEDLRRKTRRFTSNRRSLENDSENERKLDPLPEEKTNHSPEYKRVYPDWKPSQTLEKTDDLTETIEAIEGAKQSQVTKDKSLWRKSNLNVSNSSEEIGRIRKPKSLDAPSSSLQSILEEDKRKTVIKQLGDRGASDRLSIYIRRPSNEIPAEKVQSPKDNVQSIYIKPNETESRLSQRLRRPLSNEFSTTQGNKIEIDSDNIETPPVVRKTFNNENRTVNSPCRKLYTPRPLHKETIEAVTASKERTTKPIEQEVLGDGQFDRHSNARRTRRYKRPTDYSSGNEEISPEPSNDKEIPKSESFNSFNTDYKREDKESRLKRWQEKLKCLDRTEDDIDLATTKKTKIGRHISSINQEDVREAIRSLKSPTDTPERVWSPSRDIIKETPTILVKTLNPELNDEGFEETQSLVSDTPSHGKESSTSCNEGHSNKKQKPIRTTSTDSATTTGSGETTSRIKSRISVHDRLSSLDRTRSMRGLRTNLNSGPSTTSNLTPRRTNSLRKTDSQSSVGSQKMRDVERSSSRNSLRSSRSSLNSAISTNTVRKMPVKLTSSSQLNNNKKPLFTQNNSTTTKTTTRIPASRSSSSGSSIGTTVRKPPLRSTTSTVSTSFKENQNSYLSGRNTKSTVPASRSSSSGSSISVNKRPSVGTSSTLPRTSGFMRPTAASATKVTGVKLK